MAENEIFVNLRFAADTTPVQAAVANVKRQMAELSRANVGLMGATGRALPGVAQQSAALGALAARGDQVAASFLKARQQGGMFYKIFSGNVKENLATLLKGHMAYKRTIGLLGEELNNVTLVNDRYGKSLTTLADQPLTKARIKMMVFGEHINRLADNTIRLGKQWQWVGRQLIVGVTAPFIAATAIMGKKAIEINRSQVEVQKFLLQTGQSAASVARVFETQLGPALEETAKATGISVKEINDMAASWVAAGFGIDQGLDKLTDLTAKLSLLTQGDIEAADAFELVRSIMSTYGLSVEDTTQKVKNLQLIQSVTSLQMADMAFALPKAASAAKTLGITVEETAASLAGMRERGVQASEAANALKTILTRLADPTNEAKETFESITNMKVSDLVFEDGQSRGIQAIKDLAEIFKGLNDQQKAVLASTLAGARQVDRFTKLLESAVDPTSDFATALKEAGDEAKANAVWEEQLAVVTDSLSKKWDKLKVRLEIAAAKLGETLLPVVEEATDRFIRLLEIINEIPDSTKQAFAKVAGAIAAIGPVIFTVAQSMLVLGNLMKGMSVPLRSLVNIKSMETPEVLNRISGGSSTAGVLSGLPLGANFGKLIAEHGDAALISAALAGGNLPKELAEDLAKKYGDEIHAALGGGSFSAKGHKGFLGKAKAAQMALMGNLFKMEPTGIRKLAESSVQTYEKSVAEAAGASKFTRAKRKLADMFNLGSGTKTFIVPGGETGTAAITAKFTSHLGKLAVILPIVIAALANWRDIWKGMQPFIEEAVSIIKGAIEVIVEAVNDVFNSSDDKIGKTGNVWIEFGALLGKVVKGIAKVVAFMVGLFGAAFKKVVEFLKSVGTSLINILNFFSNPMKSIKSLFTSFTDGVNPIIDVIGRLTAFVIAAVVAFKGFLFLQKIIALFGVIFRSIQLAITGFAGLRAAILGFSAAVNAATSTTPFLLLVKTIGMAVAAFSLFGNTAAREMAEAQDALDSFNQSFTELIVSVKEGQAEISGGSVQGIFQQIKTVIDEFVDTTNFENIKQNVEALTDFVGAHAEAGNRHVQNMFEGLESEKLKEFGKAIDGAFQFVLPVIEQAKDLTFEQIRALKEEFQLRLKILNAQKEVLGNLLNDAKADGDQKRIDALKETLSGLAMEIGVLEKLTPVVVGFESTTAIQEASKLGPRLEEALGKMESDARKGAKKSGKGTGEEFADAFKNALEAQLARLTNRVVESIMDAFDAMADRKTKAIDKEIRAIERGRDKQIKAIQDQIDALHEQNEEEERLLREQERRRRRQELLDNYAIDQAIKARERIKAINEGRFDDARILELQMGQETVKLQQDLADIEAEAQKEKLEQLKKEQEEALEEEIDALEKQTDKKIKILEKEKKMLEKQLAKQRELLENMLDDITQFGAKNVAQWQSMYGKIVGLAKSNGVELGDVTSKFMSKFGHDIGQGLSAAVKNARKLAVVEAEKTGQDISDAVQKGVSNSKGMKLITKILGWLEEIEFIRTNPGPDGATHSKKIPGLMEKVIAGLNQLTELGVSYHTGGPVAGSGEVPAVLEAGEYVINKRSASKLGSGTLNDLNKYHHGGMVGKAGAVAVAKAGLSNLPMPGVGGLLGSIIGSSIVSSVAGEIKRQVKTLKKELSGGGEGALAGKGALKIAPVDPPVAFWNDWGAPRPGGRTHMGNDIFVARPGGGIMPVGTANTERTIRASFPGYFSPSSGGIAGNSYTLSGSPGKIFGAHLFKHLRGAGHVPAGEPLGIVGNTGNAIGTAPHLHFQLAPGGGSYQNPFGALSEVYGNQNFGKGQPYGSAKPPQLGTGGIVRFNTPAMLHAGETVIPANVTKALSNAVSNGTSVNISLNVEGHLINDESSQRKLFLMLEQAGRKIARSRGNNNVVVNMQ